MSNKHDNYMELSDPEGLAEQLVAPRKQLQAFISSKGPRIKICSSMLTALDTDYPYTCYVVDGQSDNACKLTAPADLPTELKGLYKIDVGLQNIYACADALLIGVQACAYSHFGDSGTATVAGMSAMKFNTTRPSTPTSQHNKGRAFDVKLQGRMMSDGNTYDQYACAYLCLCCAEAGATRIIFSDKAVVDAVNKTVGRTVCIWLNKHENHIHMDNR